MGPDRPWIESDGYEADPRFTRASDTRKALARSFHDTGLVLLRHAVDPGLCAEVRRDLVAAFDRPDGSRGSRRSHERLNRVAEAWEWSPAVRRVAGEPAIVDLVEFLYGTAMFPFQTLDFKWGSEQRAHRDVVHFDTIPSGFMCGVWVALEDVGASQGPLRYHPTSHAVASPAADRFDGATFDYGRYEDAIASFVDEQPFETVELSASLGDAVVWAAGLIHGGAPVADPASTRWSQVTHYFGEGCVYVTPMHSRPDVGEVALREPLVDVRDGRRVRPMAGVGGSPPRVVRRPGGRAVVLAAGDAAPRRPDRVASTWRAGQVEARHAAHVVRRAISRSWHRR